MKYIDSNDFSLSNTCVAFGEFDGIHSGHSSVISSLTNKSKKLGLTSVVVCFNYAEELLSGRMLLSTEAEKKHLIADLSPDVLISLRIDEENKDDKTEDFIRDILIGKLGAKVVAAGSQDKNIEVLRKCAKEYGYELVECETVCEDGEAVTSERILNELSQGTLEKANKMLGHAYLIMGEVMHGKALGRTVGMPTANIGYETYKQLPAHGVYGTLSDIEGKKVKGLTNIGKRPSVDNFNYVTIEDFLLDFSGNLYGKVITLEVHVLIRGVMKFNNIEEVKSQVNKDIESIRAYLDNL